VFIRVCIVPAKEAVANKATETINEQAKKVSMETAGTRFSSKSSYWRYPEYA
jgi:hypothetical protein